MLGRRKRQAVILTTRIEILDCYMAGVEKRIRGVFKYEAERDPFAVCLTFQEKHRPDVPWFFARELLLSGTALPHGDGDGDVAIWPLLREGHNTYMGIKVESPAGITVAVTKMKPVMKFIKEMERQLPMMVAPDSSYVDNGITWLTKKIF
jgi:hypothetical protein